MPRPSPRPGTGLALIGARGSGKSTVGRLVADRLGRPFADADRELELRAGRSIARIFEADGEPHFRDLEASVLADLADRPGLVLATGGGAVLREANRQALRRLGFIAWLDAPAPTLADRLRLDLDDRPALTDRGPLAEIADILEARRPLYLSVADATIATEGRTPAEVADLVLDAWGPAR